MPKDNPPKIWLFLSTVFYIGNIRFAPGTFGPLATIPFFLLIQPFHITVQLIIAFFVLAIGFLSTHFSLFYFTNKDPKQIVIDEFAALLFLFIFFAHDWLSIIICFLFFRFFDILKIPPINWLERKFSGSFGIMIDDIFAAIYSGICMTVFLYFV